jgi:hypothetical protein
MRKARKRQEKLIKRQEKAVFNHVKDYKIQFLVRIRE